MVLLLAQDVIALQSLTDIPRECGDVHPLYRGPRSQHEEDDHEVYLDDNLFDGSLMVTFRSTFLGLFLCFYHFSTK